jgi:hypothetical protein
MLADRIRHHPDPHQPIAGGILAPSERIKGQGTLKLH